MRFAYPYFVSAHAIEQFKKYVDNLPSDKIIREIQGRLQNPGSPVQWQVVQGVLIPIFQAHYQKGDKTRTYYIPVVPGEGDWPAVPTIISSNSPLHKNWCAGRLEPIHKGGLHD